MLSPTITRSLLSLNSLQPSNTWISADGKSMSKEQFRNPQCYISSEKPRVWFSVNKLWRSHSTLIWNFLYKNQLEHSPSWSPFPHTTHTQMHFFFYLKSANPLHIKLAHPDSSAQLPTLSHKTPGEICLQAKIQRIVKRTLDSWFQMKASTLLLPFLTYPPRSLPCSWDAQTARQNSPSHALCRVLCGWERTFLTEKTFPCQ